MMKPNQTVNEILELIYPPAEAIVPQLNTIKQVSAATIRMYESTQDIHTIFPNLDMIQRAIDYLRGAPMLDELRPLPEDTLKPAYTVASTGFNIMSSINKNGEYDITVQGFDVEPEYSKELFGDQDIEAVQFGIGIPVTCGKTYMITQVNPALYLFPDDPSIYYDAETETWTKEKIYTMDEDTFTYAVLLDGGRDFVKITISEEDNPEPIVFNITSHIHFKKKELEVPTTPDTEDNDEDTSSNG